MIAAIFLLGTLIGGLIYMIAYRIGYKAGTLHERFRMDDIIQGYRDRWIDAG